MAFGTDQVLLYNVEPWAALGFGVPNFADVTHTVNQPAQRLADEIGKLQLYLMTHVDVMREAYPSRNTVERLGKMVNRVRTVLASRAREANQLRLEPGHGSPAPLAWQIHPVPYFRGPILRNGWLMEYNRLTMMGLANLYQHSDNTLALTITQPMAADVWQYFGEIARLLGTELLGLSVDTVLADGFMFGPEHYQNYAPENVTIRTEAIQTPTDPRVRFTETDLQKLYEGYPANLIVPNLAIYPAGGEGAAAPQQAEADPADGLPGVDDGSALRQTT